jgi:hypothetical protein
MSRRSRADFYVRSIAVLGLGCLAATAAWVDSWSVPVDLPMVVSAFDNDSVPVVQTLVEVPGFASSTLLLRPMLGPREAPRVVRAMVLQTAPISSRRVRVRWTEPAMSLRPLPVTDSLVLPLPVVDLASIPEPEEDPAAWQPLPVSTIASDRSDDGLFSEMLRKTSSSFGRAGSSMVGAFRSLSGVVKRVF